MINITDNEFCRGSVSGTFLMESIQVLYREMLIYVSIDRNKIVVYLALSYLSLFLKQLARNLAGPHCTCGRKIGQDTAYTYDSEP